MNGINTFDVDRQVVIHTAVTLYIRQLGKLQTTFPAFRQNIYQTAFLQHLNERGFYVTLVAILTDYN